MYPLQIPSYRLLVAFLSLLFPLSSTESTPPPVTPPPRIDLKTRDMGDGFIIRKSCNTGSKTNDASKLDKVLRDRKPCDVVIRTRKRGLKNILVEIDIEYRKSITGPTKLDPTKTITLEQGPFKVECKPDGEVVATSSDNDITIAPSPIVSFTADRLYCSFIMKTSKDKLIDSLSSRDVILQFTPNGRLTYSGHRLFWDVAEKARCDPDLPSTFEREDFGISYKNASNEEDEDKFTCLTGKLYIEAEGSSKLVNGVECVNGRWTRIDKEGEMGQPLNKPFIVTCGLRFCSQCNIDTLSETNCPSCSKAQVSQVEDECSKITCTPNRWILDDKWIENPTMECAKITNESYGWKANGVEVKKGACTSIIDCLVRSKLELACDARKAICQDPTLSADRMTISCDNANHFHLGYGDGTIYPHASLVCDTTTGFFKRGKDTVPAKQSIGCYKSKRKRVSPLSSQPSTGSLSLFAWLPVLVLAIVVFIAGAALIFYMKRREAEMDTAPPEERTLQQKYEAWKEAEEKRGELRGAMLREKNRIRLTPEDQAILQEKKRRRLKSSNSDRDSSKSSSVASTTSTKKSGRSKRTGRINIYPPNFYKRELNPSLRAPYVEPYEITKDNIVPAPRNAANCPDSYSTSMDFPNPRLRERARTVSTTVNPTTATTVVTTGTTTVTKTTTMMTTAGSNSAPTPPVDEEKKSM